jgi:hypothetical protein
MRLATSEERDRSEAVVDRIVFARDGGTVAAFSRCDIHVFSPHSGKTVLRLFLGGRTNTWDETGDLSPDSRWLAHANNWHGAISVRDLKSPSAGHECQALSGHAGEVEALAFSPDCKWLVSCGADGTVLVWDAWRLTGKAAPVGRDPADLDRDEARDRWELLGDADPHRAAEAMAALIESPAVAVPLIEARLKPAEMVPQDRIERLVAELDSNEFARREKAAEELRGFVEQAAPALRKALEGKPSAELTRRARQLLAELEGPVTSPQQLRTLRAVEVLERIGTAESRKVLETLATGAPAQRTSEARASLNRWSGR